MKVRDYVRTLTLLEAKRAEFESLINGNLGVHTMAILQREIENAVSDIMALESLELETKPQIIRIGLVDSVPMLEVGDTFTLALNYTLTDGSLVGFGLEPRAQVVITDVDGIYDNTGYITSITAKDYVGKVDMSLKLTRTVNGFDVFDDNDTQGLQVVEEDGLFSIVDTFGESIGVEFTEEGTVAGDDFRVLIIRNTEPLAITVNDDSVVSVEGFTLTALQAGATQLVIEGDGVATIVDVEVKDTEPVEPTEPEEVKNVFQRALEVTHDDYTYTSQAVAEVTESETTLTTTYPESIQLIDTTSLNDLSRYFKAVNSLGENVVTYNGTDYTWNDVSVLKGSKFEATDGTTLMNAVATDTLTALVTNGTLTTEDVTTLQTGGTLVLDEAKDLAVADYFSTSGLEFTVGVEKLVVKQAKA